MRIGPRKAIAAVGLLASAFALTTAVTPASARVTSGQLAAITPAIVRHADGHVTITVGGLPDDAKVPAAPPSTSPAVTRVWIPLGGQIDCGPGFACAGVPWPGGTYMFKFYNYGGYSVTNWLGSGWMWNHQTGNAGARYDNVNGTELGCVTAGSARHNINWDPVYRVRLTAAGC